MTSLHRLSLVACAFTMPLLASCNVPEPIAGWFTVVPETNKFEVLPLEQVQQDTVRRMLQFNEWPFELKASPVDKTVACILEIQEKGKPPRKLSHFTILIKDRRHRKVSLGIMPVSVTVGGGQGWKILFQDGGGSSTMVVPNLLKRKSTHIPGGVPRRTGEHGFVLITAREGFMKEGASLDDEVSAQIVVRFVPSQKEWDPRQPLQYQAPMSLD